MGGVKLASYYGCLLVRPASVAGGDDVEQPMFMDDVVAACGAEPVDWNMKVECCGGAYGVSRTSSVVRLGRAIVEDARKDGAEAIVVACPLCQTNLDLRQKAMESRGAPPLPILYITEIVGLALGPLAGGARHQAALGRRAAVAARPADARRRARRGRQEGRRGEGRQGRRAGGQGGRRQGGGRQGRTGHPRRRR